MKLSGAVNAPAPIQTLAFDVLVHRPWQGCEPQMSELTSDTLRFVRVAAAELREIAEQTPDIAVELRRIADELEAEVSDIEKRAR